MVTLKPDEMNDLTATNANVPQIGKCICIMGGRMQFAPTNVILRCTNNPRNPDSKPNACKYQKVNLSKNSPLLEHQNAIFSKFMKTFGNGTPGPFDHFPCVII